ncbi:MAG: PQQ-dependent sugar dehydrogenase [Gaiellaceae bacterium]
MRRGLSTVGVLAGVVIFATAASGRSRPRFVVVARGFVAPSAIAAAPEEVNRLYVAEQAGRIRVVEHGRVLRRPFLDIRGRVRAVGNLGLFSFVFDPGYRANHLFYVYYAGERGNAWLVRFRSRRGVAVRASAHVLFHIRASASADAHDGGGLAVGPDGALYRGVGDGFVNAAPQDLSSPLGKILRLDVRRPTAPAIVAYGLRNPWRLAFDRRNGGMFVGDVGESHWEEVDYRRPGTRPNFGWSVYEGRTKVSDRPLTDPAALTPPLYAYRHPRSGCAAVIGGYVYRGHSVPSLRGRYVFGDLCGGAVWSLRPGQTSATRIGVVPTVVSSFGEDSRGELYAAAVNTGAVYRLVG